MLRVSIVGDLSGLVDEAMTSARRILEGGPYHTAGWMRNRGMITLCLDFQREHNLRYGSLQAYSSALTGSYLNR